jgi:hypothetical protein
VANFNIKRIDAVNVAVGDNAQAGALASQTTIGDHVTILQDLRDLHDEMQGRAVTADEDLAVVAVSRAIDSAQAGDSRRMAEYLQRAGRWALDIATALGTEVAAAAIRSALGMQ